MKFINYLSTITGIGVFPLISLIIFVAFFVLVTLFVIKADKNYINMLANMPVEDQKDDTTNESKNV
ncbi:MAG: hypothetical protein Fur0041_10660 [Bacteroidia bacterium]